MAPVLVPMQSNRKTGSHANDVGLLGNPCCAVYHPQTTKLYGHGGNFQMKKKYLLKLEKFFLYFQPFSRLV